MNYVDHRVGDSESVPDSVCSHRCMITGRTGTLWWLFPASKSKLWPDSVMGDYMKTKPFSRKVLGVGLSTAALAGTSLAAATGALPMQLQDFHGIFSASSSGSVTLPSPNLDFDVTPGYIFGLCTAYLNNASGTTTTTAPTTTTTAPTTTTTAASTVSVVTPPPGVPELLAFFASVNNESVTQFCASVNPKHAELKLGDHRGEGAEVAAHVRKSDTDDTTTTTTAPTTTTTAPTTTTTAPTTTTTSTVTSSGDHDQDDVNFGANFGASTTSSNQQQGQGSGANSLLKLFGGGHFSSKTDVNAKSQTNNDWKTKSSSDH